MPTATTIPATAAAARVARAAAARFGAPRSPAAASPRRARRTGVLPRAGPAGANAAAERAARAATGVAVAPGSEVLSALSALLSTLGVSSTPAALGRALRAWGGGGGGGGGGWGGGGGGWDAGDHAARLVDILTSDGQRRCLASCAVPCSGRARVDPAAAGAAAERLARAMDAALRRYKSTTLLRYLHTRLTALVNAKLVTRRVPVLRATGIRPVLGLGTLLKYDVTRGVRLRVLQYVFQTYVDWYLPGVKYDLRAIDAELFARYRPQVVAFLRGRDGDLAPIAGMLVRHAVEVNGPDPACALCRRAFSCG
jgi:hypothetical protein